MYLNFYNKLGIRFNDDETALSSFLRTKYKYYLCDDANDISDNLFAVNSLDKIRTEGLSFINREAAFDKGNFYILDNNKKKIRFNFDGELVAERYFDINIFDTIFTSIILIKLCISGFLPLHSSSVVYENSGIVFAGWAGTGKTRMLLKFIVAGAKFVSDEWTFLNQDKLFTYFVNFQMADYDIKEFPECANLSFAEWIKLKANFFNNLYGLRQIFSHFNLMPRSKYFSLPDYFSGIYNGVDFHELFFLQSYNGDKIKKTPISLESLAEKAYQIFLRENRLFFYYYNLCKFADLAKDDYLKGIATEKGYKSLLSDMVKDKQCYLLEVPLNIRHSEIDIAAIIGR